MVTIGDIVKIWGFVLEVAFAGWWIWLIYIATRSTRKKKGKKPPNFKVYLTVALTWGILLTTLKFAGRYANEPTSSVVSSGEIATYRDAKRGIQFEHPSGWTVKELTAQDVLLVISPVVEADWQANVFVELRTDLESERPIESRLDVLVRNLAEYKEAFALTSSQPVNHPKSGFAAGELVYTHVTQGVPLTDKELILWLPDDKTLFVTASAVTSLWEKYEDDLNVVLTSVRPFWSIRDISDDK